MLISNIPQHCIGLKMGCYSVIKFIWTAQFLLHCVLGWESEERNKSVYLNISGDIVLGALFPIHRRGARDTCDKIQLEDGVQPLEALLYTIDKINQNEAILPGIQLGVMAVDTCDSPYHAMEQSLNFIKGFIAHGNELHNTQEFECSNGERPKFLRGQFDRIVGVIGGQSSSVSIQVATLLRLFRIPQISYMSTSPLLSNRERFPYFFRTVPSDRNQALAILNILRHFNWTYVAVIYTDSEYGIHCYEMLRDAARSANDSICFTSPYRIIRDQTDPDQYTKIIQAITNKPEIRVIILILEKEYTKELIKAAALLGVGKKKTYVWIGTDAWSSRESVVLGQEDIVEGAIAIQPLVGNLKGFDDYFTHLDPLHSNLNPWFREFWEEYFQCKLASSDPIPSFNQTCSEDLKIGPHNGYIQQSFIHFVRDAAYAYAYALNDMHKAKCHGVPGLCEEMQHIDGEEVYMYLNKTSFKDEEDSVFRFESGDGPTRYTIVSFQRTSPESQTYHWKKVGNFSSNDNEVPELKIDENIQFRLAADGGYPKSSCAQPCQPHEVKVRDKDDTCCWKCRECGGYEIIDGDYHCKPCALGYSPDRNHKICLPIPEQYTDYRNPWAILSMSFASFGILTTVFVGMVFWIYNDTPIIKAAGRELSYVLLAGIFLSFCVTFVIVAEPNQVTCGIMRFFLGFCPTLCYAAIVTKTNRIARIFHRKPGNCTSKTKYISPTSQMIIVGLLTAVDVIINIIWIYWKPPEAMYIYPERGIKLKICEGLESYSYMVGFIYPVILIGFCTIYAIQTRKCPGGFNETKYIAFTNYTIIIIWLAFVPLYIASASSNIRVVTLAISLSLSGVVELGCLFFPKVYIVLFKPEKNTKEVVMAPNRSSFATLSTPPNPPLLGPPTSTPQPPTHLNGKFKQELYPEGILISSDNFSEPPSE